MALSIGLQMCNPILINRVILYIQKDEKDLNEGLILIGIIVGVRFFYALLNSHATSKLVDFYNNLALCGVRLYLCSFHGFTCKKFEGFIFEQ